MKIQIIQLDEHDDIISARDKMAWCKTARILLVWPKNENIFTRQLDLVLLERTSRSLGSQLGLIVHDRKVRANADDLGIPVFSSVARAQRSYWRHKNPQLLPALPVRPTNDLRMVFSQTRQVASGERTSSLGRAFVFCLGISAVLLLLVAFVPGARVSITPNSRTQQIEFLILANEAIRAPSLNGSLPLRKLSLDVEGQETLPSSGRGAVPLAAAAGYVEFTNLTDQLVDVPAGTLLNGKMYGNVYFSTSRAGQVSAGLGKSVTIPVKAVLPGEAGNLPARAIDTIAGSLGLSLEATNSAAMSGGASKTGAFVDPADLSTLEGHLNQTLLSTASDRALSLLKAGDQLLPKTLAQVSLLEETHFPEVGQPGDSLTLSMHAEYSVFYLSGDDLHSLSITVLDANLPAGYSPANNDIKIKPVDEPMLDANNAVQWKYQAQRTLQESVDFEKVGTIIRGLRIKDATQRLAASLNLTQMPEIGLSPWWWPRLPIIPMRIAVFLRVGK